jgi:hypothetical protein
VDSPSLAGCGCVCSGFTWLRIGTVGVLSWMWWWILASQSYLVSGSHTNELSSRESYKNVYTHTQLITSTCLQECHMTYMVCCWSVITRHFLQYKPKWIPRWSKNLNTWVKQVTEHLFCACGFADFCVFIHLWQVPTILNPASLPL